jgi:AP-1 complex subunit sigma 1/2
LNFIINLLFLLSLKAYFILDELMIGGHVMEPSKKVILKAISSQEALSDETT